MSTKSKILRALRKGRTEVTWDAKPPLGVNYQTHKLSLVDAIETASILLDTDMWADKEELYVGRILRNVIRNLPQFSEARRINGLLPTTAKGKLMGSLASRDVYFVSELTATGGRLKNSTDYAAINVIHSTEIN